MVDAIGIWTRLFPGNRPRLFHSPGCSALDGGTILFGGIGENRTHDPTTCFTTIFIVINKQLSHLVTPIGVAPISQLFQSCANLFQLRSHIYFTRLQYFSCWNEAYLLICKLHFLHVTQHSILCKTYFCVWHRHLHIMSSILYSVYGLIFLISLLNFGGASGDRTHL